MKALDLYERGLGQHEPTGGQSDRPRAGGIDLDQKAMTYRGGNPKETRSLNVSLLAYAHSIAGIYLYCVTLFVDTAPLIHI